MCQGTILGSAGHLDLAFFFPARKCTKCTDMYENVRICTNDVFSQKYESVTNPGLCMLMRRLTGGVYRLGLFSMVLASRSVVAPEQPPNQQCTEAHAVLWGFKIILNVGIREAHLFGDNAAALVQFLRCKASVGRVYQQRLLKCFRYMWASGPGFTVYIHLVSGVVNPADPTSRLHGQFAGDLDLALQAATCRVGDLWAFPDRKMVFLWTLGIPMGPFVLPQAWRSGVRSYDGGGGRTSMRSSCSIGWRSHWGR